MKNRFSRNIKLGKLTISIFPNELVFVYAGSRHVYIKTLRPGSIVKYKKPFIAAASVIILAFVFIFPAFNKLQSNTVSDEIKTAGKPAISDDEMKDKLLKSSSTDFSIQKESTSLIISRHKVLKGEVLSQIAKKYGVSMDTICGSNNLVSYDLINEGAVLSIPSKDGILYKMKKGKGILALAKKYKVSMEKILKQNDIKNQDFIPVGMNLFIPDARPQNIFPGYLWPTISRRITCGYGWRRNPFNRRSREFHKGLDIRAKYERVRSTKFGKITYAGWLGGYGKSIIVAHPGGIKSLYAHMSRIYVRKGQYVKQGQFIGRSGNTGRSTGAHLHVEIIKNGRHKNPFAYLSRK